MCYNLLIFERHLPQTVEFVYKNLGHLMVLDHIAKPLISRNQFYHELSRNIIQLSECKNVYCKLSGMVAEVEDYNWEEALLKTYFETMLNIYGAERVMFGSD